MEKIFCARTTALAIHMNSRLLAFFISRPRALQTADLLSQPRHHGSHSLKSLSPLSCLSLPLSVPPFLPPSLYLSLFLSLSTHTHTHTHTRTCTFTQFILLELILLLGLNPDRESREGKIGDLNL